MLTAGGLVLIADTRTNAGIDNISVYKKLHTLAESEDRLIMLASAGSLSVTQSLLSLLDEGLPAEGHDDLPRTMANVPTMFRAAQLVGEALGEAHASIAHVLNGSGIDSSVSLLLGGRIGDGPLQLYLMYNEGNFIECEPDSPFLQIGELKYGKPMLDRTLQWNTTLDEVVKVGLISFDSTMRSNLSVGRPLDLIVVPSDRKKQIVKTRIEPEDAYFDLLSDEWGRRLHEARSAIPDPPFLPEFQHP
jgi:putative proteasome-type protease